MTDMGDAAILYARLGLSVIPLEGKNPWFDAWPEKASNNLEVVTGWWKSFPNANVGIATGPKSNVFVVDIDPDKGGRDSWDDLRKSGIPDTWQAITGRGGTHYYFRYPNFRVKTCAGIAPGIDIRGAGGQAVAAPSIHPDTHRRYVWDGSKPIEQQPIAEAPEWLLNLLAPKDATQPMQEVPLKIPHGTQHHTLVSLAGMLRRLGLTADEILPSLMAVHNNRCERPGPPQNVAKIAQSMMKYAPGESNLYTTATKLWRMTRSFEHQQQEAKDSMKPVDAYALLKRPAETPSLIIVECLHRGCTILAGAPKSGKSWLTLGLALSVASGGKFIGARDVLRAGRVAYWALEEVPRRTRARLETLTEGTPSICLQNIEFMYALKPMFDGGLADLEIYCQKTKPDVMIIDTLMAFVTGQKGSRRDIFREDYREIKALSDLANRHDAAIIVVHHTNKSTESGVAAVAGTHGITAAADCVWTMHRQPQRRAVLEMVGREIDNQTFLMELDLRGPIGWHSLEQGDDVVLSGERQVILEVLRESGPKSPKQLAAEIGKTPVNTRQLLHRMLAAGLILKDEHGIYSVKQVSEYNPDKHQSDRRDWD